MKKLVLVLVCAVILTVFIAMNYLLWDKEKNTKNIEELKQSNEYKDVSIEALGKEIKGYKEGNNDLAASIDSLNKNNGELLKKIDELTNQANKASKDLENKSWTIYKIKQQIDWKPVEAIIKKWCDDMGKGQFESAYSLMLPPVDENGAAKSLTDFTNVYQGIIKKIKIKSIELDLESEPKEMVGEIIFNVTLDAEMSGSKDVGNLFVNGTNQLCFTMKYDINEDAWIISSISKGT